MPPKATPNVKTETVKKKVKKHVPSGIIYIMASFNNTIITFTDQSGNTIAWSTAGATGFKGSRKGTPFAAQLAAETAAKKAMDAGMRHVNVFVTGPGGGREAALRVFNNLGFKIGFIKDMTPIPHNGCRPAKRRRV
jgi:small subunit ribosomal protein S11